MKTLAMVTLFFISAQIAWGEGALDSMLTAETAMSLRDPFQVPTLVSQLKDTPRAELELAQLKDIKLNGVITGPKKTRALLSVPSGKTFFVSIGDRVGTRSGRITRIRTDAVTVIEYDTDLNGKKQEEYFELKIDGQLLSLAR
jgi:Tfp pilus assembly protein PilP